MCRLCRGLILSLVYKKGPGTGKVAAGVVAIVLSGSGPTGVAVGNKGVKKACAIRPKRGK